MDWAFEGPTKPHIGVRHIERTAPLSSIVFAKGAVRIFDPEAPCVTKLGLSRLQMETSAESSCPASCRAAGAFEKIFQICDDLHQRRSALLPLI
jgi:hypothetical protein